MAVHCVSEHCRREIDPNWAFCPYCGEDNRPPDQRHPVGEHSHQYLQKGSGCCLLCGEPADEPYAMKRVWRVRLAFLMMLIGVLLGLFFIDVLLANNGKTALFKDWISSWYHQPVTHRYRSGGRYTSELGDSVMIWLGFGALAVFLIGLLMLFKVPMGSRNYYDYDYDDSYGYRSGRGCLGWLFWFWW